MTAQFVVAASAHSMNKSFEITGNGGYGRLGHVKQQDEFKPRNVETFNQRVPVAPDMVIFTACAGFVHSDWAR